MPERRDKGPNILGQTVLLSDLPITSVVPEFKGQLTNKWNFWLQSFIRLGTVFIAFTQLIE